MCISGSIFNWNPHLSQQFLFIGTNLFQFLLLLLGFSPYFTAAEQLVSTMKWPAPTISKEGISSDIYVYKSSQKTYLELRRLSTDIAGHVSFLKYLKKNLFDKRDKEVLHKNSYLSKYISKDFIHMLKSKNVTRISYKKGMQIILRLSKCRDKAQ